MVFANTDIGLKRNQNQDSYIVDENEKYSIYILADGMGGYKGGEIASNLACKYSKEYIQKKFDLIPKNRVDILTLVNDAVNYANQKVHDETKKDEELKEMGTTLEICLIYNNRAYIGHVGDSRIYRLRNGVLRKLTKDHNYVQQLLDEKKITKKQALVHPERNRLIKVVGCFEDVYADVSARNILKDDILLICSDGLTNMINEEKIKQIVQNNNVVAVDRLIEEANNAGGKDNITVIMIVDKREE